MGSAVTAEPILSHYQAAPLLRSHALKARSAETSLDLARTTVTVDLTDDGVRLADGVMLAWPLLDSIARSENACFIVRDGEAEPVKRFSDETQRVDSLMPTPRAPTMLVSGFYMHRIKGTDPVADTAAKVAAISPVRGAVLDTTTGLGYTAIAAATAGAERVVTIELDATVLEICRANPWSAELFEDRRIEQRVGDAAEVIEELPSACFDRVLHDPPMFSLGGELYSAEFYRQLHRVLRPGGRLFHYVGNAASGSGQRVTRGVLQRLREAGFAQVVPRPEAFGVLAFK